MSGTMPQDLETRARKALSEGDRHAATLVDQAFAALPSLSSDLSVLRVDIARLRRSRTDVRDLTHQALSQWFDAAPSRAPTGSSGHMKGPAQIDHLSKRADPILPLARQVLLDPNSFDQSARPSFHGLAGCCFLPRVDWSPVTAAGLVLARGMAADAREMARVLGVDPTTGNEGLGLDDPVEVHGDQRIIIIGGSDNWYHFVLDYLPRLLAVAEIGLPELGWKVGLTKGSLDLFTPVIDILGLSPESVVWLAPETAHFFPRAICISNFNLEARPHPHGMALLRRFFQPKLEARAPGPERIYVSRAGIHRRRLSNEVALLDGLAARGFSVISPETLGLEEQIRLFQDARVVVGVHGSALTNIVWCRDLAGLLELASYPSGISWRNTDPHFSVLSRLLGAKYQRLRAGAEETVTPGDHMSDFSLVPAAVFDALDRLIAKVDG
jgi:hypothetical protein